MKKNLNELIDRFTSKEKAHDYALWMNFKYRRAGIRFGVIYYEEHYCVCEEATRKELSRPFIQGTPKDYSEVTKESLYHLFLDGELPTHLDMMHGMVQVLDTEILLYLYEKKFNVNELIKLELYVRSVNELGHRCPPNQAKEIWLKTK